MALCRVCLVGDIRLLDLRKYLLEVYQRLTDTELDTETEHGMPSKVCYVCHRQLQKFQIFSEMARKSNRILQDLLHNNTEVTYNALQGPLKQPLNVFMNLTVTPTEHGSIIISDITNDSSSPVAVKDEYIIEDVTLENYDIEFQECKLEPLRDVEVNNDSNETNNSRESYSNVKSDSDCFYCDVCNQMFYTKQNLVQHLKSHTKINAYPCKISKKRFTETNYLKEYMPIQDKLYSCHTCEKTFTLKGNLATHMRIHTGEKPYSCRRCGKTFTQKGALNSHMISHTGEKPYSCQRCEKTYSNKSYLKVHMRVHNGEKPYSCQRCGRTFTQKNTLTSHMLRHTGEKPYSCLRCGRSFTRKDSVMRHMQIHNRKTLS